MYSYSNPGSRTIALLPKQIGHDEFKCVLRRSFCGIPVEFSRFFFEKAAKAGGVVNAKCVPYIDDVAVYIWEGQLGFGNELIYEDIFRQFAGFTSADPAQVTSGDEQVSDIFFYCY